MTEYKTKTVSVKDGKATELKIMITKIEEPGVNQALKKAGYYSGSYYVFTEMGTMRTVTDPFKAEGLLKEFAYQVRDGKVEYDFETLDDGEQIEFGEEIGW